MAVSSLEKNISSFVEPLKGIIKSDENKHIGSILENVSSSHEPVFIFDKNKKFKGLVSIYDSLFKVRFPSTSKAMHSQFIPPYINKETGLIETLKMMLSTKLYTLPVFDKKKKLSGVIRAKTIFKKLLLKNQLDGIPNKIKSNKPITISIGSNVREAFNLLRKKKISLLVAVGENNKLEGILSRYSLREAFTPPARRQRFSKSSGDSGQAMYDEEELKRSDLPIRNFVTKDVETFAVDHDMNAVVRKLINAKTNYLILVDGINHPIGVVTYTDLLLATSKIKKEESQIIMEKPKSISGPVLEDVREMIGIMTQKINKILPLQRVEVSFKEGKVGIGRPTLIETTLNAKFFSGEDFVAQTKNWNILKGVREALNRIYKKVRRTSGKKKNHSFQSLDQAMSRIVSQQ